MNSARITIVIPAWNRESTLRRTLDSVAAQTLRPLRVVLVDNASTDSTRAIMEQWRDEVSAPDMQVTVTDEPRRGASVARNTGLALVNTEFVMFFDSDDEMLPAHCADMLAAASSRPDADIAGRSALLKLLDGKERTGVFRTADPMFNHIFHAILSTQRYIVRTELVRRVGGWNTDLKAWVDWELGIRLLLANPVMVDAGGSPTVIVYSQPESITGTRFSDNPAKWEETLTSIRRTLINAGRSDLLPLIDVRAMVLAAKYQIEGAGKEARRLATHTIEISGSPRRARVFYPQHRLMGHGSALFAKLLFPLTSARSSRPTPPQPERKDSPAQLSIVIPAWNRSRTLPRTLKSIYYQTYRPLNVILVDNNSSDTTRAIMEEWQETHNSPDFHITVLSEQRRGASSARNRGLDEVKTEYVMFFDSDDEMLPTHCADLMAQTEIHPDADIVGRSSRMILITGKKRNGSYTTRQPMINHIFHSVLSTQRFLARTDLFRSIGQWNPRLWAWEDWELGIRLLLTSPKLYEAPGKPTVIVYAQPDSITGTCFSHSPAKWEDSLTRVREIIAELPHSHLLTWVDARAIVLAARYHREGAYSEAHRLLASVLACSPHPRRMKLLFMQHRLMGCGTAIAARMLFPRTPLS